MARWVSDAVDALRDDLDDLAADAAALPWADTALWTPRTHVTSERRMRVRGGPRDRVVRIDLHGLDAVLARRVCGRVRRALEADGPLAYARVVVGRGRRSAEGRRVLAGVAAQVFDDVAEPVRVRASTLGAEDGHLDLVHRGRWRVRARGHW